MGIALDYTGKVVLVTGGTRGVGRGIAHRFLAAGAEVVVCGRNPPHAPVGVDGREAVFMACDVRAPEAVHALVDGIVARFGRLDVLVNNAGGSPPAEAATASPRFSAAIIDLNLASPLSVAQCANAIMQKQTEGGVIIHIASVSGLRASPGTAAYGAAKAGLIHLTRSLAMEWAPRVRVNAVAPGMILTEQAELHYGDASAQERVKSVVPLGRLGRPEDVGDGCLFLASDLASWVSGACLVIDGGGEQPAFLDALES